MLKAKLSRGIFIAGVLATFFAFHFTDAFVHGGYAFHELIKDLIAKPTGSIGYLGIIFIPSLIVASVVPWIIRWVRSGS